jgi:hypothetical protein
LCNKEGLEFEARDEQGPHSVALMKPLLRK